MGDNRKSSSLQPPGLQDPEDLLADHAVPPLEVPPLLGVELHAGGEVLHHLALRGLMDFGGVPPVVQLVEEVRGVRQDEIDGGGLQAVQEFEGIARVDPVDGEGSAHFSTNLVVAPEKSKLRS